MAGDPGGQGPLRVRYLDCRGDPCKLSQLTYEKVYIFTASMAHSPQVFWELRLVAGPMNHDKKDFALNVWWRGQKVVFKRFCDEFELDPLEVRPSLKSAALSKAAVDLRACVDEYIISTSAMLIMLLHWTLYFKTKVGRTSAHNILLDLLRNCLASSVTEEDFWQACQLDEHVHDLDDPVCEDAPSPESDTCCHVAVMKGMFDELNLEHTESVVHMLLELFAVRSKCQRVWQWLVRCLAAVGRHTDQMFLAPDTGKNTPEDLPMPKGDKRHRRLDPELKKMTTEAIAAKRFRSGAAMARSGDCQLSVTTAKDMEFSTMADYLWSTAALATGTKQVAIALDASRLGGEDTCFFAAFFHRLNISAWLAPQVHYRN